jgi:hypothetical protein
MSEQETSSEAPLSDEPQVPPEDGDDRVVEPQVPRAEDDGE